MNTLEANRSKWGVLLLNMGGPASPEQIKDYLYRLFCDPHIFPLPALPRKALARLIAFLRTGKASRRYAAIGGTSPLLAETKKQRVALEKSLSMPVAFGMRYSYPFIKDGVSSLKDRGVDHIVLLPLYPQYSSTTTQSALDYLRLSALWEGPSLIIESYYNHPEFISMHSRMLSNYLGQESPVINTAVMFIAHSIPLSRVRKGDPYVSQVESTVALISETINSGVLVRTAYQSRVGPVKWQGPTMDEILEELIDKGISRIIAHPVSFASENLETLFDLDIELKQKCRRRNVDFIRVPAPGTNLQYIEALASTVEDRIHKWEMENA